MVSHTHKVARVPEGVLSAYSAFMLSWQFTVHSSFELAVCEVQNVLSAWLQLCESSCERKSYAW